MNVRSLVLTLLKVLLTGTDVIFTKDKETPLSTVRSTSPQLLRREILGLQLYEEGPHLDFQISKSKYSSKYFVLFMFSFLVKGLSKLPLTNLLLTFSYGPSVL